MPLPPALQARLVKRGIISAEEAEPGAEGKGGCPNKGNPFHTCTDYCVKRWGEKNLGSQSKAKDGHGLVLPPNWRKVVDEKTLHPYFWNIKTSEVSWYPPPGSVYKQHQQQQQKDSSESKKPQDMVARTKKKKGQNAPYTFSQRPRKYKPAKEEELDPMDPAAYSDTPRGTWTAGLDMRGEAKTGVDTTANGPLYQMRPYPSPGDILRANKQSQEDKTT